MWLTLNEAEQHRARKYRETAARKREEALSRERSVFSQDYYTSLVNASTTRTDPAVVKDRKQIEKDLHRTWGALPPVQAGGVGSDALLPLLRRILSAYIERGRSLCATSRVLGIAHGAGAATTPRGILTGYPQGLNFLAGMNLMAAAGSSWDGTGDADLEETAFWLLALLLEDVLDPDFFGADVRGNLQMAYIGGLGMRSFIVERAEAYCPCLLDALGQEAFRSSLGAVLDSWVLRLFLGCAPHRLMENLWDHLLLPSLYHDEGRKLPRGLATIISFALAALKCCGEDRLKDSKEIARLAERRRAGDSPEELSLEAGEAIQSISNSLARWPATEDKQLLNVFSQILYDLANDSGGNNRLWDEVRKQKQRIADCAGNFDEQLMSLARRTHFTVQDIEILRDELNLMLKEQGRADDKDRAAQQVDLATFKEVVRRAVPEFPPELCGRLFDKLDHFGVGLIAFVNLACGISTLSLGSMDEKLQVCFDLFDSEGRRALTLKDLTDLCTTLFRVALAQGFEAAKTASTDEVIDFSDFRKANVESSDAKATTWMSVTAPPKSPPPSLPSTPSSSSTAWSQKVLRRGRRTASPTRTSATLAADAVAPTWEQPWRSMLLRLLAAAQVRTPGGPWLVAFEDFRNAAHMEPALLCLFSWCLPRPPEISGPAFLIRHGTSSQQEGWVASMCRRVLHWFGRETGSC